MKTKQKGVDELMLEVRDMLAHQQDRTGNSDINKEEIELINQAGQAHKMERVTARGACINLRQAIELLEDIHLGITEVDEMTDFEMQQARKISSFLEAVRPGLLLGEKVWFAS